jgi:outer membrane immunogenic protein
MKNSKLILSAAVAVSAMLGIGAASAADLAVKAMPYAAPVPVFSWTGCYVGVHAGAGAMRDSVGSHGSQMSVGTDYTGTGGLAGGQVGCNYQDGNWVFGAEGEGYWSGMKTTDASSFPGEFSSIDTAKNKYDFSIAARAGIAFDRTLVYGKAGWVWGKFDFLSSNTGCIPSLNLNSICLDSIGGNTQSSSASGTLDGLLLGVGIEHAITNNWTIKLEYNYLKYGSKELSFTSCNNNNGPTTCFADGTGTVHADKQIFKIGANYLFNMGGAPLVAKY